MYDSNSIKISLNMYKKRHDYQLNVNDVLHIMEIARSTLYEWINKYYNDGIFDELSIKELIKQYRLTRPLRTSKISEACKEMIINYTIKSANFNMHKLIRKIKREYCITVCKSSIYKLLKDNGITYKKVQKNTYPHGKRKFNKEVKSLKTQIDAVNNDYISIDESAVHLGTTPNRGWYYKGSKCVKKSSFNRKNRYSYVSAINTKGVVATKLVKGSINSEIFSTFIKEDVIPKTNNKTILMDNARIHKTKKVKQVLDENGMNAIFNVPYSPQFNPIELTFNTIKQYIKSHNVNTFNQLEKQLKRIEKKLSIDGFKKYYDKTYGLLAEANM